MAVMEEALCEYLLTKSAVTDLLGSGDNARLWPIDSMPQNYDAAASGTAATYEIISSDDIHTLSDRSGLVQSRVQIATYAATRKAANSAARAIKNCGVVALKGTSGGVDFRGVSVASGIETFAESPTDGGQEYRFICDFDLMISYVE